MIFGNSTEISVILISDNSGASGSSGMKFPMLAHFITFMRGRCRPAAAFRPAAPLRWGQRGAKRPTTSSPRADWHPGRILSGGPGPTAATGPWEFMLLLLGRASCRLPKVGGMQSRPNRQTMRQTEAFPCDRMQSRSASDQSLRVNLSQSPWEDCRNPSPLSLISQ